MKRSNPQNARLWSLYHKMSETLRPGGEQYSPESYHVYYKSLFLGRTEISLPNKQTMLIPRSTADLDVNEFSDFLDRVQADAAERGIFLDE